MPRKILKKILFQLIKNSSEKWENLFDCIELNAKEDRLLKLHAIMSDLMQDSDDENESLMRECLRIVEELRRLWLLQELRMAI